MTGFREIGVMLVPWIAVSILSCSKEPVDRKDTQDHDIAWSVYASLDINTGDTLSVLYVPNAFVPNSDGINDYFGVRGTGITEFEMKIFSRWGELLFESRSLNDRWDGSRNGRTVHGPAQYPFHIRATGDDGKKYDIRASLSLLR